MKAPITLSRRTFVAASAALLAEACGGASTRPASAGAPFRVVDTMPAFFAFWDRAEGAPIEEARALFRELVMERYPAVYAPSVLGAASQAELDVRLDRFLPKLPALVPVMRRLHQRFGARLEEGTRRFLQALPSFSWDGACYLLASIDGFNGAGREVDGRAALLFGLDVMADLQPDRDPMVLIHHELFHFHQAQGPAQIYAAMWFEGLATYASLVLNPGTAREDALPSTHLHDPGDPVLDAPDRHLRFADAMPEHAASLGAALLRCLDSEAREDYATFFLGRASPALGARPVRSAYYFGLEIVSRLAGGRSLEVLADLDPASLRAEIEGALRAIIAEA